MVNKLEPTIQDFANHLSSLPDDVLEKDWPWQSYDSEGVRFGILRIIEMLEALNARERANKKLGETEAFLTTYRQAYWDLQAVVWGLNEDYAIQPPAEGEWDVRTAYAHILSGELGFFGVLKFSLNHHRSSSWSVGLKLSEDDWDQLLEIDEKAYAQLMQADLATLRNVHREWHQRILTEISNVEDVELDLPSRYWEAESYPIRFRLGRFASHLRQHTIQIEKSLKTLGALPGENNQLLRHIFRSYASNPLEISPQAKTDTEAIIIQLGQLIAAMQSTNETE